MNPIVHSRKDALMTSIVPLPAAGKSVNTEIISIGQKGGIDKALVWIEIQALAALVAGKKVTAKLQSSADGTTFTDVVSAPTVVATGAEGGSTAQKAVFRIPYDAERYLRVAVTADAACGDVTTSELSFSICV